ncbi:Zinc finger CCCH domain-containing protein 24 [Apostasia shenzhenica]|uniref:Zinc finger CCCH domain-containing protein 24 n=1 Tax=Apostasia shenzhenica TaxID=1088818 RepID=A0A2I0AUN4_9ASPA|nr:Zinc finger CCCH domain-containing protein 24 [Apostasia shenzhenica]
MHVDCASPNGKVCMRGAMCGNGNLFSGGAVFETAAGKSAPRTLHELKTVSSLKSANAGIGQKQAVTTAEDVIGDILKEYLDIPQKPGILSDDTGSKGTQCVGTEANDTSNHEEHNDAADSAGAVAANGSMKEVLPCPEDRAIEKIADSTKSLSDKGRSEQPIGQADDLVDSVKICAAEDTGASLDNESCRGAFLNSDNFSNTNKDSVKFLNKRQENGLLWETKVANAPPVYQFKRVIAIVDPPRVGLHPILHWPFFLIPLVLFCISYISCNPESLVANAIELCTPTADNPEKGKGNRGWRNMSSAGLARYRVKSMPSSEPFRPVRAMAVDLFPHTPHCEMVMLLER